MLDHEPIFGKNVIETLSEGMYDNPLFLFREYVQNSADAIDAAKRHGILLDGEGQIEVVVDKEQRIVLFEDNGTGIPKNSVKSMLANIGDSQKNRKTDKGFRGIGRLGGLGYCQKVRFETTFKGENVKSVLEWDAKNLHEILADPSERINAGQLIRKITITDEEKCDKEKHFFKVSLININSSSDNLLDVENVKKYLSMVAPVPFDYSKFPFVEKIEKFIKENNLHPLSEYCVYLNNEEIRKGYKTPLSVEGKSIEILDIECKVLQGETKTALGWLWFGVSQFEGVLKCWQGCLRLRKNNIQIGEADCLLNKGLWREDTRGSKYFIGEVHALDPNLTPNSRRDYFNQDSSCRRFEQSLISEFKILHSLYRKASEIRSAYKDIYNAQEAKKEFECRDRNGKFYDEKEREKERESLDNKLKKSEKAQRKIEKIEDDSALPGINSVPIDHIINAHARNAKGIIPASPHDSPKKQTKFARDTIKPSVKDVLDKVFDVLAKMLPEEEAAPIKDAIVKRFQRK